MSPLPCTRSNPSRPCRRLPAGVTLPAVLLAVALGATAPVRADEGLAAPAPGFSQPAEGGFSYFVGMAWQRSRYRETAAAVPVRSEATSGSPLLVTGALYAVTPDWLASLDNETTFAPSTVTETWNATAPTVAGTTLSSPVLQTNQFRFSDTVTRVLAHRRMQDQWFALGGLALRSQSFRRFGYVAGPDGLVTVTPGQTTEETQAEVLLQFGAALESETLRGRTQHYGVRVLAGVPVWRRVENTAFAQTRFDRLGGWDLTVEARYSRALSRDVQLGGWLKLSQSSRPGQSAAGGIELPRHRLGQMALGAELLWKL